MSTGGWRRLLERLELLALGQVDDTDRPGSDPVTSPAVLVFGGLAVTVGLYMAGAVALVQGGGVAALTLGMVEMAVSRGLDVPARARLVPLLLFVFGVLTVLVGVSVLWW